MNALKWIVGGFCLSALICVVCAARMSFGQSLDEDPWLGLLVITTGVGIAGLASSAILFLIVGPRVVVERFRQNPQQRSE